MQCSKHEDKESVAVCKKCRREMCAQCVTEGEKLIPKSGVCVDCGREILQENRRRAKYDMTKMIKTAIRFAIFYAIGIVLFVAGIKNAQAGESIIPTILMCIAGSVIAGLPFAKSWRYIGQSVANIEKNESSEYYINIDERGNISVREDNSKKVGKTMVVLIFGIVAGIVATPISIIVCIITAVKNNAVIKNIDGKLLGISAPSAANNSGTESKN